MALYTTMIYVDFIKMNVVNVFILEELNTTFYPPRRLHFFLNLQLSPSYFFFFKPKFNSIFSQLSPFSIISLPFISQRFRSTSAGVNLWKWKLLSDSLPPATSTSTLAAPVLPIIYLLLPLLSPPSVLPPPLLILSTSSASTTTFRSALPPPSLSGGKKNPAYPNPLNAPPMIGILNFILMARF